MYKNKSIIAIVPARGGSKGVKLKNLRTLAGKPLIAHVGDLLSQIHWIDKKIVSTDHPDISRVAQMHNLEVPFIRPYDLSGDFVGDLDVLTHALLASERFYHTKYDIVLMLQPTSPTRTIKIIQNAVDQLIDNNLDSVWSISKVDLKYHPYKQLLMDNIGHLSYFDANGRNIIARQQLNSTYIRNGMVYALTRECIVKQNTILGKRAGAVLTEKPVFNIDSESDLNKAETYFNQLCHG